MSYFATYRSKHDALVYRMAQPAYSVGALRRRLRNLRGRG